MNFIIKTAKSGHRKLFLTFLLVTSSICEVKSTFQSEEEFEKFILTEYETNQTKMCYDYNVASWEYSTDINNDIKERKLAEESLKLTNTTRYFYRTHFKDLHKLNLTKEWSKRHAKYLTKLGDANLPHEEYERLTDVMDDMYEVYSSAKVCPYDRRVCDVKITGLSLKPDIEDIMANSEDPQELAYYWEQYRTQTGLKLRPLFKQYVGLSNKAAKLDKYSDTGDLWRELTEVQNLEKVVDRMWNEVKPLYDELHFYVLHKLAKHYGNKINVSGGFIPAHITGDIHSYSWTNIISKVVPFPQAGFVNLTSMLQKNSYGPFDMFRTANDFFVSMGLEDMSMAFGEKGVIEKPQREIDCEPTTWEFCNPHDFRISMCTKVTQRDFFLIYHGLSHLQSYIQYRDQPVTFRDIPSAGLDEAIAGSIVLSAMSTTYLKKVGLLEEDYKLTFQNTINNLMAAALKFVPSMPYALILDKWRWGVFRGNITENNWNESWWTFRKSVQKIKPPVYRSTRDFDPGSKYHVAADVQYIPDFIATIMEFQIYKGLCIVAEKYHPYAPYTLPLHECDFYNSIEAGNRLKAGMRMGNSVHWSKILRLITGETKLSTKAILEYFQPLMDFLVKENKSTRMKLGK